MMIKGITVHSLGIPEEKVLHTQLNFREGFAKVLSQMLPVAKKLWAGIFLLQDFRMQ
jgi:hypothetical protein